MRMNLSGLLFLVAAAGGVGVAGAVEKITLRPGTDVELSAASVKLRAPKEFPNRPFQTPEVFTYQRSDTGAKVEACDPRELFVSNQVAGNFAGPDGRLVVATMLYLPPRDLPLIGGRHVRQEDFQKAIAEARPPATAEEIRAWVEAFVGDAPVAGPFEMTGLTNRQRALQFVFKSRQDGTRQGCVLPGGGAGKEARPALFLFFDLDDSREFREVSRAVATIVGSVQQIQRREVDKTASRTMQARKATKPGAEAAATPAYAAAKERVIQNIRNLKDWWYLELPDYILASNMDSRNRRLVTMIQEDIESMRAAYEAFIPARVEITEVSVVRVFRERDEYLNYIPKDMQWSAGIWMPMKKELVVSPLEVIGGNEARRLTLAIVYHEAFHQYIFYALGGRTLPVWFDEGHAALFEGSDIDSRRKTVVIGEEPMRVNLILERLKEGRPLNLEALLRMDHQQFYSPNQEAMAGNYSTAYALVYFLRKGSLQYPGRGYDTLCDKILDAAMAQNSGDPGAITAKALAAIDIRQLERDVTEFWKSSTRRHRAERAAAFGAPLDAER